MIVTLTGPTCAGKSTIERALQELGCGRAISHTTRPMRVGEVDGREYHFISDEDYDRLKNMGAFVETVEFGSNRYAMSSEALNESQRNSDIAVIVVEPKGALQIHDYCRRFGIESKAVWVDCSEKEQARRWVTRLAGDLMIGSSTIAAYASRLEAMLTEEKGWREGFATHNGMLVDGSYREFDFGVNTCQLDSAEIAAMLMRAFKPLSSPPSPGRFVQG